MRSRREIERDYKRTEELVLEVLLDLRDILVKATKKKKAEKGAKDADPRN